MRISEANIEFIRVEGVLSSVSVVMPIWDKPSEDGFLSVNIPLFGIQTFAENEDDASEAVNESVHLFCLNSEKFGEGLEKELRHLGWTTAKGEKNITRMSFNISNKDTVIDQIMQTGDQFAKKLDLALAC